jgi:hypothetical protein
MTCEKCYFMASKKAGDAVMYECHRFPPTPFLVPAQRPIASMGAPRGVSVSVVSFFAAVSPDLSCGEFVRAGGTAGA